MEVSGFNGLLHLYETEDTALAAFAKNSLHAAALRHGLQTRR